MVTKLTFPVAQSDGTEGTADSLDWGLNMYLLFAER